jgi:hypothetical protein
MKSKSALAAAFAGLLLSSAAFAQSWQQVGPTPPDYTMYYDAASLYREGTFGMLVTLVNFSSPRTDPNVLGGSVSFYSSTTVTGFDCSTFEIAGIGDFRYHSEQWAGGRLVFSDEGFDRTRRPINSGTANEAMYYAACR